MSVHCEKNHQTHEGSQLLNIKWRVVHCLVSWQHSDSSNLLAQLMHKTGIMNWWLQTHIATALLVQGSTSPARHTYSTINHSKRQIHFNNIQEADLKDFSANIMALTYPAFALSSSELWHRAVLYVGTNVWRHLIPWAGGLGIWLPPPPGYLGKNWNWRWKGSI
jgi:hypothetical protein